MRHGLPVALAAVALKVAAACGGATAPPPAAPPEPEATPEPTPEPPPETTEVVTLPWQGEVQTREDFCRPEREALLDTSNDMFRRVEIRAAGLELIERATYRQGPATEVVLHGGGCTHDTVTITFTVRDATAPTDTGHYREVAAALLAALPMKQEPPNYASVLAEVLEKGTPDPDTPNLMVHDFEPVVTFDVEAAGDGAVKLTTRYDFPL